MQLSGFSNSLFSEGSARVSRTLEDFAPNDLAVATRLIADFERTERMEMPAGLPALDENAALWAAQYLYRAIQFVLLREMEEPLMEVHLQPFEGKPNAANIWSVDLLFRHLGPLFKFSSGLAPDDPLVTRLRQTAAAWPLSSVGLDIALSVETTVIMDNPALRTLYLDRIITAKDLGRLAGEQERAALIETAGIYQDLFWPGLELNEAIQHD